MIKGYYNPTVIHMQNFSFLDAIEPEIWAFKEKKMAAKLGPGAQQYGKKLV